MRSHKNKKPVVTWLKESCRCRIGCFRIPAASPERKPRCNHVEETSPLRSHATVNKITYEHTLCSRPVLKAITAYTGFFPPSSLLLQMELQALFTKSINGFKDLGSIGGLHGLVCNQFPLRYLQAYVMEKLFPIMTISTCGTSLGMSWWWERANRKTSYSWDPLGNNPPVEKQRMRS